jgi:hypothetical protein
LMEVTVVSGLMAFLTVLLSWAWAGVGRTNVDLIVRGTVAQEIDIATTALCHDLSGNLPEPAGALQGTRQAGRLLAWRLSNSNTVLELCYDSLTVPNDTADWSSIGSSAVTVQYRLDTATHTLIRTQMIGSTTDSVFTVARNVDAFALSLDADNTLHISLTFACYYRTDTDRANPILKRTCTFVAKLN